MSGRQHCVSLTKDMAKGMRHPFMQGNFSVFSVFFSRWIFVSINCGQARNVRSVPDVHERDRLASKITRQR